MRHTITLDEVKASVFTPFKHHIASSSGKGSSKRLVISVSLAPTKVGFEVVDHDRIVYEGDDIEAAVNAYNEAP